MLIKILEIILLVITSLAIAFLLTILITETVRKLQGKHSALFDGKR